MSIGVHPSSDQGMDACDSAVLADLDRERVDPDERVRPGIQGALPERADLGVEMSGHLRDLRARQALDPELLGQPLDPPGRDPEQIRGGHHGDQGLLGSAAMHQQPVREERALTQLRDRQLHGASTGVPLPRPIAIAPVGPSIAALAIASAANLVGLRGHHRVGERGDHLAQQIRRRVSQMLLQQRSRVHTVRCGHRGDPLVEFLGRYS